MRYSYTWMNIQEARNFMGVITNEEFTQMIPKDAKTCKCGGRINFYLGIKLKIGAAIAPGAVGYCDADPEKCSVCQVFFVKTAYKKAPIIWERAFTSDNPKCRDKRGRFVKGQKQGETWQWDPDPYIIWR